MIWTFVKCESIKLKKTKKQVVSAHSRLKLASLTSWCQSWHHKWLTRTFQEVEKAVTDRLESNQVKPRWSFFFGIAQLQEAKHRNESHCNRKNAHGQFHTNHSSRQGAGSACCLDLWAAAFLSQSFTQRKLSGRLGETNQNPSTQTESKTTQPLYSGLLFEPTFKQWAHTRTSARNVLIRLLFHP